MEDLATILVSLIAAGSLVLTVTWLLRGVPGLPWLVGHATLTCTGAAVWATHVLNEGELGYRPAPWLSLVLLMTAGGFGIGFLRQWRPAHQRGVEVGVNASGGRLSSLLVIVQAGGTAAAITAAAAEALTG